MPFQKSSSNVKEMMDRKLLMSVFNGKLELVCLQECNCVTLCMFEHKIQEMFSN